MITWSIKSLKCIEDSIVDTVVVRASNGSTGKDVNVYVGPVTDQFIEYSSLSQDVVMGWVKSCLGQTYMKNIETEITNESSLPILTETALPW
jgi:hypothetical protein